MLLDRTGGRRIRLSLLVGIILMVVPAVATKPRDINAYPGTTGTQLSLSAVSGMQ